jgi:hypothetical protein
VLPSEDEYKPHTLDANYFSGQFGDLIQDLILTISGWINAFGNRADMLKLPKCGRNPSAYV